MYGVSSRDCLYCGNYTFACKDNKHCVPEYKVCDGIPHCTDGSDEENCYEPQCAETMDDVSDTRRYNAECKDEKYVIVELKPVNISIVFFVDEKTGSGHVFNSNFMH